MTYYYDFYIIAYSGGGISINFCKHYLAYRVLLRMKSLAIIFS